MHDHHAREIEHEDVFLAFVTNARDDFLGLGLRRFDAHLPRRRPLVVIGGDRDRRFDHVADVGFLLLVKIVAGFH